MIEIESLVKRYKTEVLRGVSLRVPTGSIYALIGPGASGKSVLLKAMAGLVPLDAGHVRIDGEAFTDLDEVALAERRKLIGMQFQNYALFDFLSVGENIAFPLRRLFNLGDDEIRQRVAERLERVALGGFEPRNPSSLSGGQKKRVGIARATVARPGIVLYDEPTAGLDPVTSRKIYDLIRDEQNAAGTTCVIISSDVQGVLGIADRVAMMLQGEIIFDGTVSEARETRLPAVRQFVHGLTEGPL